MSPVARRRARTAKAAPEQECPLRRISWEDLQALTLEEKAPFFSVEERFCHVLFAQQFDRSALDRLGALATRIRHIAKNEAGMEFLGSLLAHKGAMLYFTQPSTRTFLSFRSACQILGMRIGDVRDTATSSEFKGETQEDSVRTFSSYFDLIIMRSRQQGLAERMAWMLSNSERPVPIVNAGSGKDQHPTQALLDVYTLQRSFEGIGGIDGKSILFVGDLARGRTVRSLSCLLKNYRGVRQYFCAPEGLQIGDDILQSLRAAGVEYEVSDSLDRFLPLADAVYMTRIQDEWDVEGEAGRRIDLAQYSLTAEHLPRLKPHAAILHPLPRRTEISTDVDHDPRAMYWRQMRNGMWIRVALIASIFDKQKEILKYYGRHVRT